MHYLNFTFWAQASNIWRYMVCVLVYKDIRDVLSARRKIWWVSKKEIKMHNLLIWCISSMLHFEQKQAIYPMINDMCNSISGHQRLIISKKKNMMSKQKREIKMTRIPAPGIEPWPRTATWCGQMLYPLSCGELVNILGWILESCLRCPTHCKDQAWKHKRSSIGQKESRFNGLQWTQLVKRNSGHLDLPFLFLFFIWGSQWG